MAPCQHVDRVVVSSWRSTSWVNCTSSFLRHWFWILPSMCEATRAGFPMPHSVIWYPKVSFANLTFKSGISPVLLAHTAHSRRGIGYILLSCIFFFFLKLVFINFAVPLVYGLVILWYTEEFTHASVDVLGTHSGTVCSLWTRSFLRYPTLILMKSIN